MKNKWFAGLTVLMVLVSGLSMTSCSVEKVGKDASSVTSTSQKETEKISADVSVEQQILLDSNGIKVTLDKLDTKSGLWGPELLVTVENNTQNGITVQAKNTSINGIMTEPIFSCDVAAGKKGKDSISFDSEELKTAGIDVIKEIELSLYICDIDTWDTILDSDPIRIQTIGSESYTQQYDDSGIVAVDRDGVKIVVKKLNSEDSFWGADVSLYIENNTQQNITVQARDVSVNGFMIDPNFSCDVLSGKKAYDSLIFFDSDLEENGIDDITDLELCFYVFDMDKWEDIFITDPVTVSFK